MKMFIAISLCCASEMMVHAAQQVITPNNLSSVEGNSSLNDFLNVQSFRMQMVISASEFSSLSSAPGVSNILSTIWFRIDGASTDGTLTGFGGSSVTLSITPRGPDNLSPVFAENVGANPVTVFNGGLQFGQGFMPGADPQPFALSVITGGNWFNYSPAQGNLLVDIRGVDGRVLVPGSLDAQSMAGDAVSRVFASSNLASSGLVDTLGLVARFDFVVVPEPSTWMLSTVGFASLFLFRCRRIRQARVCFQTK